MKKLNRIISFAISSLISFSSLNFCINGMQIDDKKNDLYIYDTYCKHFVKYDSKDFKKEFNKFKTSYDYLKYVGFSARDKFDNNYMTFNTILKNQKNKPKYIFKNNELPDKYNEILDPLEKEMGYNLFSSILKNICLDWQKNQKNIEDLDSNYIFNYIKDVLLNARKAELRECGKYTPGLIFDGNVFLPYDCGVIFPKFSYDYDVKNCKVTFRFLKKNAGDKLMVELQRWHVGSIIVDKPDYDVIEYDEYGNKYYHQS